MSTQSLKNQSLGTVCKELIQSVQQSALLIGHIDLPGELVKNADLYAKIWGDIIGALLQDCLSVTSLLYCVWLPVQLRAATCRFS